MDWKADNFKFGIIAGKLTALDWVLGEKSDHIKMHLDYEDWVQEQQASRGDVTERMTSPPQVGRSIRGEKIVQDMCDALTEANNELNCEGDTFEFGFVIGKLTGLHWVLDKPSSDITENPDYKTWTGTN